MRFFLQLWTKPEFLCCLLSSRKTADLCLESQEREGYWESNNHLYTPDFCVCPMLPCWVPYTSCIYHMFKSILWQLLFHVNKKFKKLGSHFKQSISTMAVTLIFFLTWVYFLLYLCVCVESNEVNEYFNMLIAYKK